MNKAIFSKKYISGFFAFAALALIGVTATLTINLSANAQEEAFDKFREGEKLTYNVSFEKFKDAAYAEMFVASKGTIEGKKAVEIRGKIKSVSVVSAAFYLFDHSRTVFASEETGFPLYIKDVSRVSGLPVESISNYLKEPSTNLDLLTMLYRVRENGGAGSFSVLEKGRIYSFDFASTGGEVVETAGMTYETNVSSVTSNYFSENGITDVIVNFSTSPDRIPVKISFRTGKGRFLAKLASASILAPTPTPTAAKTIAPTPTPTQTPSPTPTPYIENKSLSGDLPFEIGEKLNYRLSNEGKELSTVEFSVDSRKEIGGIDSLVLKAAVSGPGDGSLFSPSDHAEAFVDPYTLVPHRFDLSLMGPLASWSQLAVFDQGRGLVTYGGGKAVEVPIGTHSLLSFVYAVRSFNLRPSKDPKNPVNDTRVAVFTNDRAYILTLRPSSNEKIKIDGKEVAAQLITVITGDPKVDRLRPRIWLSTDSSRVLLKVMIGNYEAELVG